MGRTVLSAPVGVGTSTRRARRSLPAVLAAVALVAAGCGGSNRQVEAKGPQATNADGSPAEFGAGAGSDNGGNDGLTPNGLGSNGPGSNGPGPIGATASTTTTTTRRGGSTGSSGSSTTTTATGAVADTGARGGPGAYARTLLRAQSATRIVVELLVQAGAEPNQGTVDHLVQVLGDESRKPVTTADRVALPAGDGTTTADDIRTWSDRYSRVQEAGDRAVLHVLFLKGRYYEPTPDTRDDDGASALGVAVRGDTFAVFKDTVKGASTPLVSAGVIEDAVAVHETGHLLGLVDIVLHTGRADPEHPGHSSNKGSVMYYAVDADIVTQALDGGPPSRTFDSADKADLAAIRTGA
jgi:hypothetical protein